ncbi:fructose-6-phosphate aldolase [Limnochorda pilosa]|uniref:Probable transaldolase n=1 Tax=Limnochorda pilosa TaxID=1555112 RepID=A0A0K2SHI6_LIMPI|nr:fructose-6-phosphate aldolase [Limnochorda pilosa]BAS26284.1 transaldolase [Limnochorda pilosa]
MELFLDTAQVDEIREARDWGVLDGVTTNPSHVAASGRPFLEVVREICALVDGPVSAEVTATLADEMMEQGRLLSRVAPNVVVKVPATREGIKAIRQFSDEGISTNATLVFTPAQALLAAKAGATYVSPFVGRLDAIQHHGMELVEQIRRIHDNYSFPTKLLVAAVRHPDHVVEAALIGADAATLRLDVLRSLYEHPLVNIGLQQFLDDWARIPNAFRRYEL